MVEEEVVESGIESGIESEIESEIESPEPSGDFGSGGKGKGESPIIGAEGGLIGGGGGGEEGGRRETGVDGRDVACGEGLESVTVG